MAVHLFGRIEFYVSETGIVNVFKDPIRVSFEASDVAAAFGGCRASPVVVVGAKVVEVGFGIGQQVPDDHEDMDLPTATMAFLCESGRGFRTDRQTEPGRVPTGPSNSRWVSRCAGTSHTG